MSALDLDELERLRKAAEPLDGMVRGRWHAEARWAFERAVEANGAQLLAIARAVKAWGDTRAGTDGDADLIAERAVTALADSLASTPVDGKW